MKKMCVLVFIIMMLAVVTAVQAEVRAGGLPAITVDEMIPNCSCKIDPSCCAQPAMAPAPEPAPVMAPPPEPAAKPVIIEKGRQTLDVEFDFNKAIIKQGYYKDIDDLAKVMKDYPDLKVVIEGHTDNIGTAEYNKNLSQERAEAVKKYLVEKGIDANRITAQGFGFDRPIASNDTEEGRQKNRRVEAAVDYLIEK